MDGRPAHDSTPKLEPRIMRYELTDGEWAAIRPMLPHKARGVPRVDDRRVLNGICWVLRSGAPWRDLPDCYGSRFCERPVVQFRRPTHPPIETIRRELRLKLPKFPSPRIFFFSLPSIMIIVRAFEGCLPSLIHTINMREAAVQPILKRLQSTCASVSPRSSTRPTSRTL
jgi:transposase